MEQIPMFIKKPDGKLYLNDDYKLIRNYTQATKTYPIVLTQNQTVVDSFTLSAGAFYSGDFEIDQFIGFENSGNLYTIQITDSSKNDYMNGAILGRTIFGTPEFPFRLPESIFLMSQSGLIITLADLNNVGGSSVYLTFEGKRFVIPQDPTGQRGRSAYDYSRRRINSFVYFYTTASAVTMAANGTATGTITTLNPGYYYILEQISCYSLGTFTCQIQDYGNSDYFSQVQIDSRNFAGAIPGLAHRTSAKRVIPFNSVLNFNFTDTSGKANQVWITLIGRQVNQNGIELKTANSSPGTSK